MVHDFTLYGYHNLVLYVCVCTHLKISFTEEYVVYSVLLHKNVYVVYSVHTFLCKRGFEVMAVKCLFLKIKVFFSKKDGKERFLSFMWDLFI